mmetsp:Transcript_4796/g.13358  ORF Transcript_4796/g.13358 Transcript_4796/m.13358 type:complete len:250 (-) Transcript_4796:19-768(-)
MANESRLQKLQAVLDRFEITIAEANDLVVLQDYDIAVIADDSGSMQRPAEPGRPGSRWDELKTTLEAIVGIATSFYPDGIDVHFLNRNPLLKVKASTDPEFQSTFASLPRGTTPLTETLSRVASEMQSDRKVLLFILTDGEPNGGKTLFIHTLRNLVSTDKLKIQIMACTSEDDEIAWLSVVDRELKEVDVTDDYVSEKKEVMKAGLATTFTRGDWCLKAMLGPVSRKFDAWDESRRVANSTCKECCIL